MQRWDHTQNLFNTEVYLSKYHPQVCSPSLSGGDSRSSDDPSAAVNSLVSEIFCYSGCCCVSSCKLMSCLRCQLVLRLPFLSQSSLSVEAETCVCETPCLWIKFFSLSCVCLSGLLRDKPKKKKAQNYLYRPFPLQGWTRPLKSAKDVTFCCRSSHCASV